MVTGENGEDGPKAFPDIAGRGAHVAGGGGDIFRDVERMHRILAYPAHVYRVDVLFYKQTFLTISADARCGWISLRSCVLTTVLKTPASHSTIAGEFREAIGS